MTRKFFNQQFAAMASAYTISQKLSDESQDVYWEMLKELGEAEFSAAVKDCLAECKFFPTIAELGESALPVNGLGYNWLRQIERRQSEEQRRLGSPLVLALIDGVRDGKKET